MAGTPGNGAVRPEDYATPEYLELLSPVVSRAQQDLPDYPLDEQELGRSIALLLQFMERELGKDAAAGGKRVPKLPVKPLRDFSSDGPLLSLVGAFESFQRDRDWEADDFSSGDAYPKSQCLELIQQVRSVWEAKGFVASPRVFVDPSCGDDHGRLQSIAAALGGAVAASADDQGITHLVLPDESPPVGAEFAPRTLEVRGSRAQVHWQRLPDSYDAWVAAQAAPEPFPEPLPEPTKPCRVSPQYLYDSHQYNEWMNPSDYALKEARGTKRGREEAPEEQEEVPEVTPGAGTELTEGVVKQVVGAPHIYAMDGLARALNLGGGHQGTSSSSSSSLRRAPPPSEAEVHRVPAHASWFRWNRINDIERRANPEFFNGRSARKTPRAYKEMRDCIINLFRHDPSRRLTFTECRSKIAADVTSVLRLWGFLDHWGIINFLPDNPPSSSSSSLPSDQQQQQQQQQQQPRVEPGGLPGGSRILLTPPATQNLFAMNQVSSADAAKAAATGSAGPTVLPQSTRRRGPGVSLPGQQQQGQEAAEAAQFLCNADPTHLCGPVRFHCTVTPDVDICGRCFADGRIPVGMARRDFVRIDSRSDQGDGGADWTEQETLLLLEALEIHGENWADVAEHVGTRSQVQCITHFLQLPIEDQFIDPLEAPQQRRLHAVPDQGGPQQQRQQQEPFGGDTLPLFAEAGNPVMTQLTVLAAIAGPRVAAAAAKAALETLSEVEDLPADGKEGQEGGEAAAAPMETDGEAAASGGAAREGGDGQRAAAVGALMDRTALQAAAATGLAAAAVKAKLLADQEERELQRLVVGVIQNQTEKLELKARLFDDLEATMERERIKLEEGWRALLAERTQFMSEKLAANDPAGGAEAPGAAEAAAPDAAAAASVPPAAGPPAAAAAAAAAAPQGALAAQAPAAVAAAAPSQQQQQQP